MPTRSVHLTDAEAEGLQQLGESTGQAEDALLERAIQRGLRELRIEEGIKAVEAGHGSSEGAKIAGMPRAIFLDLLYERGVKILDGPSMLAHDLAVLADDLGSERLAMVARTLAAERL